MAIVRRGEKAYVYRSVRRNGRVTSRYIGSDDRALLIESAFRSLRPDPGIRAEIRALELEARGELEEEARRERAERNERRAADRELDGLVDREAKSAQALGHAAMEAAGYRLHRWVWRKRRMGKARDDVPTGPAATMSPEELAEIKAGIDQVLNEASPKETVDRMVLYDSTRAAGDPSAIALLEKLFGSDPGDSITRRLIDQWSNQEIAKELLRRQLDRMRDDLLGPDPTAIERLIVARVLTCYLDLGLKDQAGINVAASTLFSPAERVAYEKARDRSSRRYLDTLKTLALVRSRALPALRLSLAVQDGASGSSAAAVVQAGGTQQGRNPGKIEDKSE